MTVGVSGPHLGVTVVVGLVVDIAFGHSMSSVKLRLEREKDKNQIQVPDIKSAKTNFNSFCFVFYQTPIFMLCTVLTQNKSIFQRFWVDSHSL